MDDFQLIEIEIRLIEAIEEHQAICPCSGEAKSALAARAEDSTARPSRCSESVRNQSSSEGSPDSVVESFRIDRFRRRRRQATSLSSRSPDDDGAALISLVPAASTDGASDAPVRRSVNVEVVRADGRTVTIVRRADT